MVYRPANPPAPPTPCLGVCVLTHLLLGVDGWTRRGTGWGGDRGVCDPAHFLGTMMVAVFVSFPPRGTAPPRIDSGRFARARVDSGGLVVFCLQHYNLG